MYDVAYIIVSPIHKPGDDNNTDPSFKEAGAAAAAGATDIKDNGKNLNHQIVQRC